MDHNRRARPTLRLLSDDLPSGWEDPAVERNLKQGQWQLLHPLSELPHPVLRKAAELYGPDPVDDPAPRLIGCSGVLRLQELKTGQWRAGIWTDLVTGVRWVLTAGLAKGNHQDGDDFYRELDGIVDRGAASTLLPTPKDKQLLKEETAAWTITAWNLTVQAAITSGLTEIRGAGAVTVQLPHPSKPIGMGTVTIEFAITTEEASIPREEFFLIFDLSSSFVGSTLGWLLIERVLISIAPPVQDWDRSGATFFVMSDLGHIDRQLQRLKEQNAREELLTREFGAVGHYAHAPHIAGAAVNGTAIRAMCGVIFVPSRDPEPLPKCPTCAELHSGLPG